MIINFRPKILPLEKYKFYIFNEKNWSLKVGRYLWVGISGDINLVDNAMDLLPLLKSFSRKIGILDDSLFQKLYKIVLLKRRFFSLCIVNHKDINVKSIALKIYFKFKSVT